LVSKNWIACGAGGFLVSPAWPGAQSNPAITISIPKPQQNFINHSRKQGEGMFVYYAVPSPWEQLANSILDLQPSTCNH
jgi:hypothetical protein